MRSPHDLGDDPSKLFYHPTMMDADDDMIDEVKPNCCRRFLSILCCGLLSRKSVIEKPLSAIEKGEIFNFDPKIRYSFTQLEIQKMMGKKNVSLQSKDSLELMNINNRKIDVRVSPPSVPILKSISSILTLEGPYPEDYKDELEMLKFLKNRKRLLSSDSKEVQLGTVLGYSINSDKSDEKETKNIEYNLQLLEEPGPSGVKPKNKKERLAEPGTSGIQTTKQVVKKPGSKRLRFNENTTMIPASIIEVDEDEEEIDELPRTSQRHSTFLDTMMGKQKFFGVFDDDNASSLQKESKRFWGGSGKGKKPSRNKNTH